MYAFLTLGRADGNGGTGWPAMVLTVFMLIAGFGVTAAQEEGTREEPANDERQGPPPARETYRGRTIAPVMDAAHADWLTRPERARQEDTATMLRQLRLEEGDVVADIGCGNGFHTLRLARIVGADGWVYGVDIQPKMLKLLNDRAIQKDIDHLSPVLGTVTDPRVPAGSCDLVLMVDVYHEFSHPERMLRSLRRILKPDGRLALVEFRREDPDVPIRRLHKMSKDQMLKELPPNGYRLKRQFEGLPWQHMMIFERSRVFGDGKRTLVSRGAALERVSIEVERNTKEQTDPAGRVYRCKKQAVVVTSAGGDRLLEVRLDENPTSLTWGDAANEEQRDLLVRTESGATYRLRVNTGAPSTARDGEDGK